mmetsp:Transcript_22463/g.31517  ORF Transcript_22463/g.31517 Transcript_22463/m.31517 type:complete len:200 (-) Transcript_22463:383-982(-)
MAPDINEGSKGFQVHNLTIISLTNNKVCHWLSSNTSTAVIFFWCFFTFLSGLFIGFFFLHDGILFVIFFFFFEWWCLLLLFDSALRNFRRFGSILWLSFFSLFASFPSSSSFASLTFHAFFQVYITIRIGIIGFVAFFSFGFWCRWFIFRFVYFFIILRNLVILHISRLRITFCFGCGWLDRTRRSIISWKIFNSRSRC